MINIFQIWRNLSSFIFLKLFLVQMIKLAIRFMNLQNSNAKKSDFVSLMREIVKETEKVPYQSRIGVQYLNRIMKISFYKVRKSEDIDYQAVCRIVNHWKEIILVKSLKFQSKKNLFFFLITVFSVK